MPRLLIGLMLLIGTILPLTAATPAAEPPATTLDGSAPVYLALGDSLAVGAGASDPETAGYVPLVRNALQRSLPCHADGAGGCPELQLLNLAENGATTETLLETQLPAALEIIERRNTDDDPGNDVVAITIDIGGNDAVAGVFDACAETVTAACPQAVQETLSTISRNLIDILMPLRAAAGPDTRIAVMTYFNTLIACDYQHVADNAELVLEGVPGITPGLNGVIRQAAERADALVADTFGLLEESDLVGGPDCLHANDAGYRKIATAFTSVLTPDIARSTPAAWSERFLAR